MLKRSEGTGTYYQKRVFSKYGSVVLCMTKTQSYVAFPRITREEYDDLIAASEDYPVLFGKSHGRCYWRYAGRFYVETDGLDAEEVYALLETRRQIEDRRIQRARAIVAMDSRPEPRRRGQIPDDLKHLVWKRDRGRCQKCGSNVELQFDHIIPFSMGGATSAANLQLLCAACNRRKGASLG